MLKVFVLMIDFRILMEEYVSEENEAIIVKPMISRTPIQEIDKIPVATLEKILVDLFCDTVILLAYKGNEMVHIYSHALKNYVVNFSKLFTYAGRRKREKQLREFMTNRFGTVLKELN